MDEQKLHVPARSVFAAILLNATGSPDKDRPDWPTIVHLSNKILDLRKDCQLDIEDIPIRADRDGWISDDFSSFVNRFVLFGLAQKSPVRLTAQALELCKKILRDDSEKYKEQVATIVRALGISPDEDFAPSLAPKCSPS
jgi:hypothetical protein